MNKTTLRRAERLIFCALGALLAAVLFVSSCSPLSLSGRPQTGYTELDSYSLTRLEDPAAPLGVTDEYRFTLGSVASSDSLVFYINHHNVSVLLDGECVFSASASGETIRTPGGIWVMLPLRESDSGTELRVLLSPVYLGYQNEHPAFLLGSELAIYKAVFHQALPELVLSLCVVLAGTFLFLLAAYHSRKRASMRRLYAISLLSISAGVWRFTYESYAYLLFENHSSLLYTLSVISLMVIALAMLNAAEPGDGPAREKLLRCTTIVFALIFIVQLILQLAGVFDLRQMLKLTHATIIISAVLLCVSGIIACFRHPPRRGRFLGRNYSWLLGIGAIADLLLYYRSNTSGMLFTLAFILCFSLLEGAGVLIRYSEQTTALAEMKDQLTLSRITTMMSQIRSHFVFNILNAISGMCKYDPEKADETVVRFARYLRSNIDIMENDQSIPFTKDLGQLEDYVVLEQVRFGDKIEFYTDIEAENFMIPPLILQPVVENAIKHGISKKLGNGVIILRTRDTGSSIVITVEDDGVGFRADELEKERSVGLKNIRFRLHHLVGGTLDIKSEPGKGTTVTITIPKKEDAQCTSSM